jgi:hypothetical protein
MASEHPGLLMDRLYHAVALATMLGALPNGIDAGLARLELVIDHDAAADLDGAAFFQRRFGPDAGRPQQ